MSGEPSLPPPEDNRQNQDAKADTNPKTNQGESKKSKAVETKSRKRRLIVYEWGFWLFFGIAGFLFFINHSFAIFSTPILWIGLILGAFAVRLALINNGEKHSKANKWWWAVAIPSSILCGLLMYVELIPQPQPEPIPQAKAHFEFSVMVNGSERIILTNDFLIVREFNKSHPIPGSLFIPVVFGESNVTLEFFVRNDSSAFAKNVETTFMAPTNWPCSFDSGWVSVQMMDDAWAASISGGVAETNDNQSWQYNPPNSLLSGNGLEIPTIHLNFFKIGQWRGAIFIMTRAKDSPTSAINFGIWTLPKSLFSNNDFKTPFVAVLPLTNFSEEKLKELQQ